VLIAAENNLGLRGTGTFGIRQRASGWYGLGSDKFLKEIARHAKRCKNYPYDIHHSEELAFFDEIKGGGLFLLTARQSMPRKGWINTGEVIVRLPGLPANTEPYQRFTRSVTTDNILFSPEHPLRRHHTGLPSSVRVELHDVITTIGSKELRPDNRSKGCISGIVLKNPFFQKPEKIAASPTTRNCWLSRNQNTSFACSTIGSMWGMKLITTFSPDWKQWILARPSCYIHDAPGEISQREHARLVVQRDCEGFNYSGIDGTRCWSKLKAPAKEENCLRLMGNESFQPTSQPTAIGVLCDLRVLWQSPRICKLL
jgi:hypothetical protein